jgi:hypothetical protein
MKKRPLFSEKFHLIGTMIGQRLVEPAASFGNGLFTNKPDGNEHQRKCE